MDIVEEVETAAIAALERRRDIYASKRASALSGEMERELESTLSYSRSDLFQHSEEAMEWAIEEVREAIRTALKDSSNGDT